MLHHDDVSIDDTIFYVHSSANIIILYLFLLIKYFKNGFIAKGSGRLAYHPIATVNLKHCYLSL